MSRSSLLASSVSRCSLAVVSPSRQPVRRLSRSPVCPSPCPRRELPARVFSPTPRKCRSRAGWKEPHHYAGYASVSLCLNRGQRYAPGSLHRSNPARRERHEQDLDRHLRVHCGQWRHAHRWLYRTIHPNGPRRSLRCRNRDDHGGHGSIRRRHWELYRRARVQPAASRPRKSSTSSALRACLSARLRRTVRPSICTFAGPADKDPRRCVVS